MELLDQMEKPIRSPEPIPEAFLALWPHTPAALQEIWAWCGGGLNPLFRFASSLLPDFPHELDTPGAWVGMMELENPGEILWRERQDSSPETARLDWEPEWLPFAADGCGQLLVANVDGSVEMWSRDVDTETVLIHQSFDRWIGELARAVERHEMQVIRDAEGYETLVSGKWQFIEGSDEWELVSD